MSPLQLPPLFARHDCRKRSFRVVVGDFVKTVVSWAVRFRCCHCGKRFTEYPSFALPHKRYVKDAVLEKTQQYLDSPRGSYRRAARGPSGAALGYQARDGTGGIDERRLNPSTVWRWLGWCGGCDKLLAAVLDLIRQKDPGVSIFRDHFPQPASKYRSDARRQCLQDAARLLAARPVFQRLLGSKIFPHFATARRLI